MVDSDCIAKVGILKDARNLARYIISRMLAGIQ